jgi:hypothetical protein
MTFASSSGSEKDAAAAAEQMAEFFGPGQIDQFIRQAIQFCWGALPKDRRTPEDLEKQIHRLVDRALKDFRDDREAFGK